MTYISELNCYLRRSNNHGIKVTNSHARKHHPEISKYLTRLEHEEKEIVTQYGYQEMANKTVAICFVCTESLETKLGRLK